MSKKVYILLALLVVASLALAACGSHSRATTRSPRGRRLCPQDRFCN